MKPEGRTLPKATPALAQRVWARQQRPSARRVATAMQQAGYPVSFVTVARWRAQNWKATASTHSLEFVRGDIEAVVPLVSDNAETNLRDLIDDPIHKRRFDSLTDVEALRLTARETAIAAILVARAIQRRVTKSECDLVGLTPAVIALARTIEALSDAFQQTIDLGRAGQGKSADSTL